jgi:hypothetical protein
MLRHAVTNGARVLSLAAHGTPICVAAWREMLLTCDAMPHPFAAHDFTSA